MPSPVQPGAKPASFVVTLVNSACARSRSDARPGAHHEAAEKRARLQIFFAHRPGKRAGARGRAWPRPAAPRSGPPRSSRAVRQRLHWRFRSAPQSGRATRRGWLRPSARSARPRRAIASSDRILLPSAENFRPARTKPAASGPASSGSICARGSGISALDGRTTSDGMRASRAAIASASAKP